jgi:2-oxoglutarate ferredoxin oxidoreductase subunit alpha
MAIEAARLALKYMTPVILLTDGYLANGAEPWKIPSFAELPKMEVKFASERPDGWHPYLRDPTTLARPWATPGTPGLEHRIGGLEKSYDSGNISYDPDNHHKMTKVRAAKIAGIANDIPEAQIDVGEETGDLLVVGWGSTYGAITQAVRHARADGKAVSQIHLRNLCPFPRKLDQLLRGFKRVIVPEMNNGMLSKMLRSEYLVDAIGINKIAGQPFKVSEIERAIAEHLPA